MSVPSYAVMFRGHPACPCQVLWIPAFETEAQRRSIIAGSLSIAQLIGSAAASASTHSKGGAADFWPVGAKTDGTGGLVWLARQMGADATWHRPYNWDGEKGSEHVHSVLRGCEHNLPARYQIAAVDQGYNGLGHLGKGAADTGPRPLSGRTWQEGIAWAQAQEDIVTEDDIAKIVAGVAALLTDGKPDGSTLTRDQLLKQGTKASQEARDALAKLNRSADVTKRRTGG